MKNEKTYYQQLQPIVESHVQHYLTDFTVHDKKALQDYTGEFYYGIRKTGTNIFCVDNCEMELNKLLRGENDEYFTARGLRELYDGKLQIKDFGLELYSLLTTTLGNERFFIGKNGKIKEVSPDVFTAKLQTRLVPLQSLVNSLANHPFVWQLYQITIKKENAKRAFDFHHN